MNQSYELRLLSSRTETLSFADDGSKTGNHSFNLYAPRSTIIPKQATK